MLANFYSLPFKYIVYLVFSVAASTISNAVYATNFSELEQGELSDDHNSPTFLELSYDTTGNVLGRNVITGVVGSFEGEIDRDYLHFLVPDGYVLSEIRIGLITEVGRNGSFMGIASGTSMPDPESMTNASGLMGYTIFTPDTFGTNVLDDLSLAGSGATGFNSPLSAGDYTLWVQETAEGDFNYRYNLILSPVPEISSWSLIIAGFSMITWIVRRKRQFT